MEPRTVRSPLQQLVDECGLLQREIAKRARVSRRTVVDLLQAKYPKPKPYVLGRVAEAVQVDVEELFQAWRETRRLRLAQDPTQIREADVAAGLVSLTTALEQRFGRKAGNRSTKFVGEAGAQSNDKS